MGEEAMARTVAGAAPSRTNRRFLIIAVLLAAVSAVLVYAKIAADEDTGARGVASSDTRQVVVAKAAIPGNSIITPDMVEIRNLAINGIALDALSDPETAIGKVTKYPVAANAQIVSSAVVDTERPAGALSEVIPLNRRAISIGVSQVSTAGGLVLPGDYVDVVWACCNYEGVDGTHLTKTVLRNVQVVAVEQTVVSAAPTSGTEEAPVPGVDPAPLPSAGTVTLLLTPEQSQQIVWAEMNGTLRVALRGDGDEAVNESGSAVVTDLLTPAELARLNEAIRAVVDSQQQAQ
jgi:pilus assembly protein CpaB